MDEYLKSMENYSPLAAGTGKLLDETKIIEFVGAPHTTIVDEETVPDELPKYMAPKTVEVRRFTLKK